MCQKDSKLIQDPAGLYYVNCQFYIIADHPKAAKWRAEYPSLAVRSLAELEKMAP